MALAGKNFETQRLFHGLYFLMSQTQKSSLVINSSKVFERITVYKDLVKKLNKEKYTFGKDLAEKLVQIWLRNLSGTVRNR